MGEGLLKKASENPTAAKIRKAIGAAANEPVRIVTPQFEREPGAPMPAAPPADRADAMMAEINARNAAEANGHAPIEE